MKNSGSLFKAGGERRAGGTRFNEYYMSECGVHTPYTGTDNETNGLGMNQARLSG